MNRLQQNIFFSSLSLLLLFLILITPILLLPLLFLFLIIIIKKNGGTLLDQMTKHVSLTHLSSPEAGVHVFPVSLASNLLAEKKFNSYSKLRFGQRSATKIETQL